MNKKIKRSLSKRHSRNTYMRKYKKSRMRKSNKRNKSNKSNKRNKSNKSNKRKNKKKLKISRKLKGGDYPSLFAKEIKVSGFKWDNKGESGSINNVSIPRKFISI